MSNCHFLPSSHNAHPPMVSPGWTIFGGHRGKEKSQPKKVVSTIFLGKKMVGPEKLGEKWSPNFDEQMFELCFFWNISKSTDKHCPHGFWEKPSQQKGLDPILLQKSSTKTKNPPKNGKKSTPNPHLAIESSTQKKRKQQKKTLRKRGRAWVVVTPAASLVEPPSRCQNVTSGVGGFLGHPFFSLPKGSTFLDFCRKSMES